MSSDQMTKACPICDSHKVSRRVSSGVAQSERYRCDGCKQKFREPIRRPMRSQSNYGNLSDAGKTLVDADPEEWP